MGGVVGGLAAAAGVGLAVYNTTHQPKISGGASPQTQAEMDFNNLQLQLAENQAVAQTQAETQLANTAYEQQQTAHNIMLYVAVALLVAMAYFYARKKKIL